MIVPSSRKLPAMTYPIQSLLQLNVPQVLCLWRLTWLYLMAASILKQSTALVVSVRKPPQGKKSPEQDGIKEKRRLTDCFIKGKVGSLRGCTSSVPILANGAQTAAFAHFFNAEMSARRGSADKDLRDGSVHVDKSRLEDIYETGEWDTIGAVGDILASIMQRVPHPEIQGAGYALDLADVLSVQSRMVTVGQVRLTETYSYDTLYDATGSPNNPDLWSEVPGFRSGGNLVSTKRTTLYRRTGTEYRTCFAQSLGCY